MNALLDLDLWTSLHLRAAGFLLMVITLACFFRKRSPFVESIIWRTGLVALVGFPLLITLAPALPVLKPAPVVDLPSLAEVPAESFTTVWLEPRELQQESANAADLTPLANAGNQVITGNPGSHSTEPTTTQHPWQWQTIATTIWLAGTCLMLLRLFFSMLRCRRLERGAKPLTGSSWSQLLTALQTELKTSRPVLLLRHHEIHSPTAWGIHHARIALPASAESWDSETRSYVLSHELTHVVRRDSLFRCVGEICRALFWFNPLIWVALKRFHLAEERAADHTVMALGGQPTGYANLLVRFATQFSLANPILSASAMAKPSTVRRRLESVLKPDAEFRIPRRSSLAPMLAIVGTTGLIMGGLAFTQSDGGSAKETSDVPAEVAPESFEPHSVLLRIYELPFELGTELHATERMDNSSELDQLHGLMKTQPDQVRMLAAATLPKDHRWAHRLAMWQKAEDQDQVLTIRGGYLDEEDLVRIHLDSGTWFGAESITTELPPRSPRLVQTLKGRDGGKLVIFAEWY